MIVRNNYLLIIRILLNHCILLSSGYIHKNTISETDSCNSAADK